jgi:4-amino-4-deoxy-L-arabinose transferase-like glycosyltransferase
MIPDDAGRAQPERRAVSRSQLWICLPLLSFVLNALFLAHDLPEAAHPDETAIVRRALAMGGGDLNPHFYKYPSLWIYLVFLTQAAAAGMGLAAGVFRGVEDLAVLAFSNPTLYFLVARLFAGALGAGAVWLTWSIGRRVSPACGWVSAGALAVFGPFVWQAHYATGDVPLVFFVMLCLATCLRGLDVSATRREWLWLPAVWAGLATSIKYNGVFVFGATAVMLALRWRRDGAGWRRLGSRLLASAGIAAASSIASSPYVFLNVSGLAGGAEEIVSGSVMVSWLEQDALAYVSLAVSSWGLVLPLAGVTGWAMVFGTRWGRRYRPMGLIFMGFCLPYLAMIQYAEYKAARFFLPVAPIVALGAGIAVARCWERLAPSRSRAAWRGVLVAATLGVAMGPAVKETIATERSFLEEKADISSARWFRSHIEPGATVFVDADTNINLPPDRGTVEIRMQQWQADDDARSKQLLRAYHLYLKSDLPARGYRLVPTHKHVLNTFQSGQDPDRDYDVRRIEGVRYVLTTADRLAAAGATRPWAAFYREILNSYCVRRAFEDASRLRILVLEREDGPQHSPAATVRECMSPRSGEA